MKRIFISAGEPSGDLYACAVAQEWLQREQVFFEGMAGPTAGLPACRNNEELQVMGISGVLRKLPGLFALKRALAEQVVRSKPDLVCLIDSPDFHLPLLKHIRRLGYDGPVAYLCPPTLWAWRRGRGAVLARHVQLTLPLFDFEARELERQGIPTLYVGCPLMDSRPESWAGGRTRDFRQVALLPGSRTREVRTLMPLLQTLARDLKKRGYRPVLSRAPGLNAKASALFDQLKGDLPVHADGARELLAVSGLAVGASGTVATEALIARCPMAVLYQANLPERLIFKMLVHTPYVSIPNLLAGQQIFPELLGAECRADSVLQWVQRLQDSSFRAHLEKLMERAYLRLGEPGVIRRWVDALQALI